MSAAGLSQMREAAESAGELIAVLRKVEELAYDGVTIPPKAAALVADALADGAVAFYAWAGWQAGHQTDTCPARLPDTDQTPQTVSDQTQTDTRGEPR
jgi:hypothetical protein